MFEINCNQCNKIVLKDSTKGKFCSLSCSSKFNNNKRKLPSELRNCSICELQFSVRHKNIEQKTCSKECRHILRSNIASSRKIPLETRKKISVSRKKFLAENPHMVPYLLNHSSEVSYPEKYFMEVFDNHNIEYIRERQIYLYSLDFTFPNCNINLEINGQQHYLDNRIIKSDKRRKIYLKENGYLMLPLNWAHYQKLSNDNKKKVVLSLIQKIINHTNL